MVARTNETQSPEWGDMNRARTHAVPSGLFITGVRIPWVHTGSHPWLQHVATSWLSRLWLRERSVTLDRLSQSVWPSINGSLLDWHFITAPADGARRPAGSTVATFYGLRPKESLLLRRSTFEINPEPRSSFQSPAQMLDRSLPQWSVDLL